MSTPARGRRTCASGWDALRTQVMGSVLAEKASPESVREHQAGPNGGTILENNWPVLFKNVHVIKSTERLGNCSR